MSESILEEAQRLIHGDRNQNYGHPRENFKNIAVLFSGYLDREVSDIDVANLMILVKVARVKGGPYHRDSFTDIAGYAGCVERIYEEDTPVQEALKKITDEMDKNKAEALWTPPEAKQDDYELSQPVPRVWDKVDDIPHGVIFTPRRSDLRYHRDGSDEDIQVRFPGTRSWEPSSYNDNRLEFNTSHGPFTEVL